MSGDQIGRQRKGTFPCQLGLCQITLKFQECALQLRHSVPVRAALWNWLQMCQIEEFLKGKYDEATASGKRNKVLRGS